VVGYSWREVELRSMPRILLPAVAWLFVGIFCAVGRGQSREVHAAIDKLPCNSCHICDKPTEKYPCLRACPRTSAVAVTRELSRKRAPELVILDQLAEIYLPVPFDHEGHAEMADMTDGCAVCHHYTPEGAAHPACKSCHKTSADTEDIRNPSLKAAYHRQCMSCHREWSGESQCVSCHPPMVGQDQEASTAEGLLSKMHPPISEPHTRIYELESVPEPGKNVVFRHKEHIDRFGLKCANCHREDTCSRCHGERKKDEEIARTPKEHHTPCSACHGVEDKDSCDHCHWKEGEAKPKPFEHARTGWVLNRFHAALACRTCHRSVPFRKLDRDCGACHGDWSPSSFDHAITGQLLDKNHEQVHCADCHSGRRFDSPPGCDQCHDVDEGIAFPAKRPGRVVIPSQSGDDLSPDE